MIYEKLEAPRPTITLATNRTCFRGSTGLKEITVETGSTVYVATNRRPSEEVLKEIPVTRFLNWYFYKGSK